MLSCLLFTTVNVRFGSAQTTSDSSTAKIKADVTRRGTGKRIEVKKLDGTKFKGSISQIGEDDFTLTDSKTNNTAVIAYRDVAKIKGSGSKAILGVTIAALAVVGIVVTSLVLKRCSNEGGC